MDNAQTLNRNYEAIAWGALLTWWGITELVTVLPDGSGPLGIGLILIGVNVARSFNGIPINRFSTTIGILALVWGGLVLAGVIMRLPFEMPVFAILLIVLGLLVLARPFTGRKSQ